MAGMFYSLQEAAERLNRTEEQVRELARAGRLREFRDGPNLLFKVDEVEALVVEEGVPIQVEGVEDDTAAAGPAPQQPPTEEPVELEISAEPQAQAPADQGPSDEAAAPVDLEIPQAEAPEPQVPEPPLSEPEIPSDQEMPQPAEPELESPGEPQAGTSEILLAPETGTPVPPSELTNADTAITGEGISVLGETDRDYEITDDTLGETIGTAGLGETGTKPEASLEEIEEDVNLDSFGSGSGLLDLSLQADDTSLGGILDEIYTAEDEEAAPPETGTVEEVAAEATKMLAEEELAVPEAGLEAPALAQPQVELAPDKTGNILGALLFLPLLFVVYTAIVAVGGLRGIVPSALTAIQGVIWYIVVGFIVVALAVSAWAFMIERESTPRQKRAAKPKKPKKKKK